MTEEHRTMNQLAVSLAGHDTEHVYAIVREDGDMVCLADGKTKTLEKPKKKNLKHIRRITHLPPQVAEELQLVRQDCDLVHVLRLYQSYQKQKEKR